MAKRKVEVVPYNKEWIEKFQVEKELISRDFSPYKINLYHIGSTSVPELCAKPIIDILAETENLNNFDLKTHLFEKSGYIAKGENGIAGRRYFFKCDEKGNRLIHLHGFEKGNPEIKRHLVFRNYLRQFPDEARRYAEVKEEAAAKFPWDIDSYIEFKNGIVKELEKKAMFWAKK
jgi:GrpB-like predicted nucleotidyltransferase (UPF0157 family)